MMRHPSQTVGAFKLLLRPAAELKLLKLHPQLELVKFPSLKDPALRTISFSETNKSRSTR